MKLHVGAQGVLIREDLPAAAAGAALALLLVGAADVAVVGGVGREGFATVFAFEGLLPRVLPDVCAEDAGGSELLPGQKAEGKANFHQREGQGTHGFPFPVTIAYTIHCSPDEPRVAPSASKSSLDRKGHDPSVLLTGSE